MCVVWASFPNLLPSPQGLSMSHIFCWTPGVLDTLRIPAGDSYSSRGQRPRKLAFPGPDPEGVEEKTVVAAVPCPSDQRLRPLQGRSVGGKPFRGRCPRLLPDAPSGHRAGSTNDLASARSLVISRTHPGCPATGGADIALYVCAPLPTAGADIKDNVCASQDTFEMANRKPFEFCDLPFAI